MITKKPDFPDKFSQFDIYAKDFHVIFWNMNNHKRLVSYFRVPCQYPFLRLARQYPPTLASPIIQDFQLTTIRSWNHICKISILLYLLKLRVFKSVLYVLWTSDSEAKVLVRHPQCIFEFCKSVFETVLGEFLKYLYLWNTKEPLWSLKFLASQKIFQG